MAEDILGADAGNLVESVGINLELTESANFADELLSSAGALSVFSEKVGTFAVNVGQMNRELTATIGTLRILNKSMGPTHRLANSLSKIADASVRIESLDAYTRSAVGSVNELAAAFNNLSKAAASVPSVDSIFGKSVGSSKKSEIEKSRTVAALSQMKANTRTILSETLSSAFRDVEIGKADQDVLAKTFQKAIEDAVMEAQLRQHRRSVNSRMLTSLEDTEFLARLKDSFLKEKEQIFDNIAEGLRQGARNLPSTTGEIGQNIGESLLKGVMESLGIHSPSKAMQKIVSEFIPAGAYAGLPQAVNKMSVVGSAIGKALSKSIAEELKNVAVRALDLLVEERGSITAGAATGTDVIKRPRKLSSVRIKKTDLDPLQSAGLLPGPGPSLTPQEQKLLKHFGKKKIVYVDLETTGLRPGSDEIVQLSAVQVDKSGARSLVAYPQTQKTVADLEQRASNIRSEIDKLTKIGGSQSVIGSLKKELSFLENYTIPTMREAAQQTRHSLEEVIKAFEKLVEDALIIGHNAAMKSGSLERGFDRAFLEKAGYRQGESIWGDTLAAAKNLNIRSYLGDRKLSSLYATFTEQDVAKVESASHKADFDVWVSRVLLNKIMEEEPDVDLLSKYKALVSDISQSGPFTKLDTDKAKEFYNAIVEYYTNLDEGIETVLKRLEGRFKGDENLIAAFKELAKRGEEARKSAIVAIAADDKEAIRQIVGFIMSISNAVGDMKEIETALLNVGEKLKGIPIGDELRKEIQNRKAQIADRLRFPQDVSRPNELQTIKDQVASQINATIGDLNEDVIFEIDEVLDDIEESTVEEIAQKSIQMGKQFVSVVDSDWKNALRDASGKIKKGQSSVDDEVQRLLTQFDRNLSSFTSIKEGDSQRKKEKIVKAAIAVQRIEDVVAELLEDPSKLAESIVELSEKFNLTVDTAISLLQDRARFLQARSTRGIHSNVNYRLAKLLNDLANEATRRDWTVDIEPSIAGQPNAHPVRNRLYPYTEWIPAQLTFESVLKAMGVYGYLPKRDSSSFGGGAQAKTRRYLDPTAGIRNVGATRMRAGGAGAMAPWEYFNRSFKSAKYQEVMSERLREAAFSPLTNEDVARIVAMSQNEEAIRSFSAIQAATPFRPAIPEPPKKYRTPESSAFFLNWVEQIEKYILPKIIDINTSLEEQATDIREKRGEILKEVLSYLPSDEELEQKLFFTGSRRSLASSLVGYIRKKKSFQSEYEQRVQEGDEPYVYTKPSEYLSRFQEILRASTTLSQKLLDLKDLDNELKQYYREKLKQYDEFAKSLSDSNASPEAIAEARTMRDFYEKLVNREDEGASRQIVAAEKAIQKINEKYDRILRDYRDALEKGEGAGSETFISEEVAKIEAAYTRRIKNIEKAIESVKSQGESLQITRLKKVVEEARQQFSEEDYQKARNQYDEALKNLNELRRIAEEQKGIDLVLLDQINKEIESISEQIKFANDTLEMTDDQLREIGATRQSKEQIKLLEKRRNSLLSKRANLSRTFKVGRDEDRRLIQRIVNATEELENQQAIISPLNEARNRLLQAELELQIATEEAQQNREIALSNLRYRKSKLESEKAAQIASIRAAGADFPAEIERRRQEEIAAQQKKITAAVSAAISDPNIRFAASEIRRMQRQAPQYENALVLDAAVKEYFGYGRGELPQVRNATLRSIIGGPREGFIPNSVLRAEQAQRMTEQLIGSPNQQLRRALEFISDEGKAKSALIQYYAAGEKTRSTEIRYLQSLVAPIGSTQSQRQKQIYDAFNFAQELLGQISFAESQIAALKEIQKTPAIQRDKEKIAQIDAEIDALKENIKKFNNVLWEPGGPIAQLRVFINIANDYVKAQISEISSGSVRYVTSQQMKEMAEQVPAKPEGITLSPKESAKRKRESLEKQVPRGIEGELRQQRVALIDTVRRGVKEEEKLAFEIIELYSSGQENNEEFQRKSEELVKQYQEIIKRNQINRRRIGNLRHQINRAKATNEDYGGVWSGDTSDLVAEEPKLAVGGVPSLPRRGPAFSYGKLVGLNADPKSVQWIDTIYENVRQISKIFDVVPIPPQIKEEDVEQYEQVKEEAANLFDITIKRYMEALSEAAYAAIKDPSNISEFEFRIAKAQAQFSRDIEQNKSLPLIGSVFSQVVEGLGKEQLLQVEQIAQSILDQVKKIGSASVAGRLYETPARADLLSIIQKKKELDEKSFLYAVRRAINLKETPLRSGNVEIATFKPIEDILKANDEILKALVVSYETLIGVIKSNVTKASRSGSFDVIKFIKRFDPQDIAGLYEELGMKESDLALDYSHVFERVFDRVARRLPRREGEEVATEAYVAFDYIQRALDDIVQEYIDTHTKDVVAFLRSQGDKIDTTIFDRLRELSPDDLASNLIVGYTEIYKSIKEHFLREVSGSLEDEADENLISRVFQQVKSSYGKDDEIAKILLEELQKEDAYQRDAFARFISSIFDARKADPSLITSIASEFAIGQDIGKFTETLFAEGDKNFAPGVITGAMRRYDALISEYFKQLNELDQDLVSKYATEIGASQIQFQKLKGQAKELRSIEDVEKYVSSIGKFLTDVQDLVVRIASEVNGLIEAQQQAEGVVDQAAKITKQTQQKAKPSVAVVSSTVSVDRDVQAIARSTATQAGNVAIESATQAAKAAVQSATNVVAKATAAASRQAVRQSVVASSQVADVASQTASAVSQTARAASDLANNIADIASVVQSIPQQQLQQAPPSSVIPQQMIAQGSVVPVTLINGSADPGVAAILLTIVSTKDEILNAIVSQATKLLNAFGALTGQIVTKVARAAVTRQAGAVQETLATAPIKTAATVTAIQSPTKTDTVIQETIPPALGKVDIPTQSTLDPIKSYIYTSTVSAMGKRVFAEQEKILSLLSVGKNKDKIEKFNADINDILDHYTQLLSNALADASSREEIRDRAEFIKNEMMKSVDAMMAPFLEFESAQRKQNVLIKLSKVLLSVFKVTGKVIIPALGKLVVFTQSALDPTKFPEYINKIKLIKDRVMRSVDATVTSLRELEIPKRTQKALTRYTNKIKPIKDRMTRLVDAMVAPLRELEITKRAQNVLAEYTNKVKSIKDRVMRSVDATVAPLRELEIPQRTQNVLTEYTNKVKTIRDQVMRSVDVTVTSLRELEIPQRTQNALTELNKVFQNVSATTQKIITSASNVKNQVTKSVDAMVAPLRKLGIGRRTQDTLVGLPKTFHNVFKGVKKVTGKGKVDTGSSDEDAITGFAAKNQRIKSLLFDLETRLRAVTPNAIPKELQFTGSAKRVYTSAELNFRKTLSSVGESLEQFGDATKQIRQELEEAAGKAWVKFSERAKEISASDQKATDKESSLRLAAYELNTVLNKIKKQIKDELDAQSRLFRGERAQEREKEIIEKNKKELSLKYQSIVQEIQGKKTQIKLKAENIVEFIGWEKFQRVYAKRLTKVIEGANKEISSRLPKLEIAALEGNREAFVTLEREIKFFLKKVVRDLDETQKEVEERSRKIDKSLANIEKYRAWRRDPMKYYQEEVVARLKYDKGLIGKFLRRGLVAQEITEKTLALATITKTGSFVIAKILSGPLILTFKIFNKIFNIIFAIIKGLVNISRAVIGFVVPAFKKLLSVVGAIWHLFEGILGIFGNIFGLIGKLAGAVTGLIPKIGGKKTSSRSKTSAPQNIEESIVSPNIEDSISVETPEVPKTTKTYKTTKSSKLSDVGKKHADEYVTGFDKELKQKKGIIGIIEQELKSMPYGIGVGIGVELVRNIVWGIQNSVRSVIYAVQSTIRAGIDEAIKTEQTLLSFTAQNALQIGQETGLPTGEAWDEAEKLAKEQFEFLRKLAKTSSFARGPIIEGYKTLRSFEYSAENARIMMEAIVRWADAFQPGNQQVIDTFTTQLGQMKTTGLLQMQDLKPLVQTANIPVMRYIAEYYRELPDALSEYTKEEIEALPRKYADIQKVNVQKAQKQIIEDMSKKGLGTTGVVMALVEGLQADSKENIGKAKALITGLISTIDDMRIELMEKITAPVLQRFTKPILEYVADVLQSKEVISFFDRLGQSIGNFSASVKDAVATVLGFIKGAWNAIPEEGKRLLGVLGQIVSALVKMAIVAKTVNLTFTLISKSFGGLLGLISFFLPGLNKFKILFAALPVFYKAYRENLLSIRDITQNIVYSIIDNLSLGFFKIKKSILSFVKGKSEFDETGLVLAKVSTEDGAKKAKALYDSFTKKISEYAPKVEKTINDVFNLSGDKPSSVSTTGEKNEEIDQARSSFQEFFDWFEQMFARANQAVRDWFASISEDFMGFAESVYQKASGFVSSFSGIWEQLKEFGSALLPLIKEVVNGVIDWLKQIPKNIQNMSKDMGKWGQELIKVFADGIIAGANFLVRAIQYVGAIISSLMRPHSPPPFLPEIDKWGKSTLQVYAEGMSKGWSENSPRLFKAIQNSFTQNLKTNSPPRILPDLSLWGTGAADAYLQGWLKADFDIMNDFANKLESALAADEGALGEDEIKRIRTAVAQMVNAAVEGRVEIDAIMRAAGNWGGRSEQVRRLAKAYAEMAVVQHKLAAEQKLLAEMTRKYDDMLKPLNRRLERIRLLQEKMNLTDEIKEYERVINNIYATDKQKEAARLKLEELGLQKQINEITEEKASVIDPIQERIDLLERENEIAREALEIAQARWDVEVGLFSQKRSDSGLGGVDGGAGVGGDGGDGGSGKDRQFMPPILPEMPSLDISSIVEFREKMEEIAERVKNSFTELKKTFDEVTESIRKIKEQVVPLVNAFKRGYDLKIFTSDSDVLSFFQNLGAFVRTLTDNISELNRELLSMLRLFGYSWTYGPYAPETTEGVGKTTTDVQIGETSFAFGNLEGWTPSLDAIEWNKNATVSDRIRAVFAAAEKSLVDGSNIFGDKMIEFFGDSGWLPTENEFEEPQVTLSEKLKEVIGAVLGFVFSAIGEYLKEKIDGLVKSVLINFVKDTSSLPEDPEISQLIAAASYSIAKSIVKNILDGIKNVDFGDAGQEFGENVAKWFIGALLGILKFSFEEGTKDESVIETVTSIYQKLTALILDFIKGVLQGVIDAIIQGLAFGWEYANEHITKALNEMPFGGKIIEIGNTLSGLIGQAYDAIGSVVNSLIDGVNSIIDSINSKISWTGVQIPKMEQSDSLPEMASSLSETASDTLAKIKETSFTDIYKSNKEKSDSLGLPPIIDLFKWTPVGTPILLAEAVKTAWDSFFPSEEEIKTKANDTVYKWIESYKAGIDASAATPEAKAAATKIFDVIQTEAPNGADKTWKDFAKALYSVAETDEDKQLALIGAAIAAGVNTGIIDFVKDTEKFNSADELYQYFLEKFEIKSPSKLFAKGVGEPIGEGIWVGINEALVGGNVSGGKGNGIASPLQTFFDVILKKTSDFSLKLQTAFVDLKTKVLEILDLAKQEWSEKFTETYDETEKNFDVFAERWINERMIPFKDNTIALVEELRLGVNDKILLLVENVLSKIEELLEKLTDEELLESFRDAGSKIGNSIVEGILDSFTSKGTKTKIERAADDLVDLILSAIKSAAGIASPSKVMAEEVGVPLLQGVTTGMLKDRENVLNAGGHLIDYIIMGAVAAIKAKSIPTESNFLDRGSHKPDTIVKQEVHYHLHITTTPAMATNAVYQFGVLESMLS